MMIAILDRRCLRKGTHLSEETKRRMSLAKIGTSWGAHSEETKRRMSETMKRVALTSEAMRRAGEAKIGIPRSEETKRKISETKQKKFQAANPRRYAELMRLRQPSTARYTLIEPPAQVRNIEYKRPWLYPLQEKAFFNSSRYSLIESSTKAGKTCGMMAWLFEQAIKGSAGQEYWWTAPVYGQAEIAFRRFKQDGIPHSISELCKWNESDLFIRLPTGVMLRFKSGEKPDNLFGENVWALAVDEASRFREEAWYALRTTLTYTKGPARIVGNVKGRKNWFYRMARKAEAGDPEMTYHKITAYDAIQAGVLAEEEILQAQRDLPENVFRELYLAEASDDEGNPFGIDAIHDCISQLSMKPPLYGGIDLAKSVDWSVIIGLDEDGCVSYFERFQKPWRETEDFIVANVGFPCFVDSTGVGDPIVEGLQRSKSSVNFESFKFTSQSKQQLMEALAVAVQKREIGFPDGPIVQEMENFEYEYTRTGVRYAAPEGLHDDTCCALALAVKARNEFTSGPLAVIL